MDPQNKRQRTIVSRPLTAVRNSTDAAHAGQNSYNRLECRHLGGTLPCHARLAAPSPLQPARNPAMSRSGAAPRAAVPFSNARAEASRRNGARSRGPKTPEGKARSAQNALKHGLRAQKYVVLPEEDGAEFAELEA